MQPWSWLGGGLGLPWLGLQKYQQTQTRGPAGRSSGLSLSLAGGSAYRWGLGPDDIVK